MRETHKEEAAKKQEEEAATAHADGRQAHATTDGHELASQTKPVYAKVLFSKGAEG